MLKIFKKWTESYFADEEAVTLLLIIALILLLVVYETRITGPILASIIIAYLLQGLQQRLKRFMSETVAFYITYSFFVGVCLTVVFVLLPLIVRQLTAVALELPKTFIKLQTLVPKLQAMYPNALSDSQLRSFLKMATEKTAVLGQDFVSFSFSSLGNIFTMMIYGVLIPLMVFFFLRDRQKILAWLGLFLPDKRPMMTMVWHEMHLQVANYSRGKAFEVFVVAVASFIAFALLGLNYALLLAFFVGLSVIVPYIGAVVVTIPVLMVSFFQFGYSEQFVYVLCAYGVIQFLDGNVLVPLLFSEAVNLHPLAIIIAVLFFGGIWGLWGVFFAIPLATLIKALISAWPKRQEYLEQE